MLPIVFAQSVGEYGGVSTLAAGIEQLTYTVSAWLGTVTPTMWIVGGAVVIGLVMFTRR